MTATDRREQAAKARKEKEKNKKNGPGLFDSLLNIILGEEKKDKEPPKLSEPQMQ